MERSTTPLTYKGSISEAIIEAQKQKKIFLVYISGEDENSTTLENSTWVDERVTEAVSRYCIFLHLTQGHVEASQFSAIYPQQSVPSISAVGYNGVMLWQHEGYINAEKFVESIEKAWATMHFQDTAAALLTAALSTNKPEPSSSSSKEVDPLERGKFSNLQSASSSVENHALASEAGPSRDPKDLVVQQGEDVSNEENKLLQLDTVEMAKNDGKENEKTESKVIELLESATQSMPNSETAEGNQSDETCLISAAEPAGAILLCHPGSSQSNVKDAVDETCRKFNDIHLIIRMPNGTSFQAKFSIFDSLRSVKNYIDDSEGSSLDSYDLAIPYPRKVFGEEDLIKTFSELGFAGRQAIIVIPKRQVPGNHRSLPSSTNIQSTASQTGSDDNVIGYFGYLKRVLSYMNPFFYFGGGGSGSSTQEHAANDDLWQYRPSPGLRSAFSGEGTARHPYSSSPQNPSAGNNPSTSRTTSRPFGSNIHTLRHDEDDFPSGDRNTFWNGNSTQFGGNDK